MKKRRLVSAILAATMLITCCLAAAPVNVSAETAADPTVVVSSAVGAPNDNVSITVGIENNPGVSSVRLKVSFDPNALVLTGATDAGILGENLYKSKFENPYIMIWTNPLSTSDITTNGTIVTLSFTIANYAVNGVHPVEVSIITQNDALDKDLNSKTFQVVNGAVTVSGGYDTPVSTIYSYDFKNYTAYDFPEMGSNTHYTMSYAGSTDLNGTSPYWWDNSSGITKYGALVGGSGVVDSGYGYHSSYDKLTLRGEYGTDANYYGGKVIKIQEGYTYIVSASYVPLSMTGWSNPVKVAVGITKDIAITESRAIGTVNTHYSNDVARGGQFVTYQPNVIRYSSDAVDAVGSGTVLNANIAHAVPERTVTATYTYNGSNTADLGSYFSIMVGTGGSTLSASGWKLSQVLITNVTITVIQNV